MNYISKISSTDNEKFTLAFVTGATSGIGRELCLLLAKKNIRLLVHGRSQEKLSILCQELGSSVVDAFLADLCDPTEQNVIVKAIKKYVPDLVINNAGFGLYGDALNYSTDEQLAILQVNGQAFLRFSLEAARAMKDSNKRGVIMNIASAAAFVVSPGFCVYSAAKSFVCQFSESFDFEMRPFGIAVLAACPGVVATNFRSSAGGKMLESSKTEVIIPVEEAALQIWNQITSRKKIHVFNFRYRVMIFFSRYILPKTFVAKLVYNRIKKLKNSPSKE